MPEGALRGPFRHLRDLPGHLDAGGSGADHHEEGEELLALGRVVGQFGLLEGTEDASAQLECMVDRLHSWRVLGELVVAEVRLIGAGSDDQAVVGRDRDSLE